MTREENFINIAKEIAKHPAIHNEVDWDSDLSFYVIMNDVFRSGADAEDITSVEDVKLLQTCLNKCNTSYVGLWLYACHKRNAKPSQNALAYILTTCPSVYTEFKSFPL